MLEFIKLIIYQITDTIAEGGVRKVFHARLFWNRLATPVVMELTKSDLPFIDYLEGTKFHFIELTMGDLQIRKLVFVNPSRGLKALRNLKKGWRGFALATDDIVVGDIWCLTPNKDGKPYYHPDLKMLGIVCEERDAYAFDMFISPDYRGKNLATPLQKSLQARMKMEGFQKVYGFYWDDNLQALWMHRILRFKELPKRRISRIFFLVKSSIQPTKKDVKKIFHDNHTKTV